MKKLHYFDHPDIGNVNRSNKFRKKEKRDGLQVSGRMKMGHTILRGDSKPC